MIHISYIIVKIIEVAYRREKYEEEKEADNSKKKKKSDLKINKRKNAGRILTRFYELPKHNTTVSRIREIHQFTD